LLKLFIEYQIPSDLMSYDGPEEHPAQQKLERVISLTATMLNMIQDQKQQQISDARNEFMYGVLDGAVSAIQYGVNINVNINISYNNYNARQTHQPARRARGKIPAPLATSPFDETQVEIPEEPVIDYTLIPIELDQKFEALDEDSALHSNIISFSQNWSRKFQKALLAQPDEENLDVQRQLIERNKAFDLLDALTKSGLLTIDQAELHVIMGATHTFDKTLINTVIQDNVNPIEKVERSVLIVATTIHDTMASELVRTEQIERVSTYSPVLFGLPSERERKLLQSQSQI